MEPLSRTERDWGARLTAERGPHCLEAAQLLALAEKGRHAPNAAALLAHIAACPGCRAVLKELRQVDALRTSLAPARRVPLFIPRLLWPVAAAAAILLTYVAYRSRLPGTERPFTPETLARKDRTPESVPRGNSGTLPPERILPPPPKAAETVAEPGKPALRVRPRKRGLSTPNRGAKPDPNAEMPVETMDAHIGWTRGELSGEVIGENVATGEVVPPNLIQGEVSGGGPRSPEEAQRHD